jgi:imidazolonepropionase-like amidohydrolase
MISRDTRRWRSVVAAVAVCSLASGVYDAQTGNDVAVIAGGTVIDGTGAMPRIADVFIADGRITAIEKPGARRTPAGVRVIDARGKWIIPGLIDGHVHYAPWMADLFLYHGVTSVCDLGNETATVVGWRDALRAGKSPGPRLFVAGLAIQGPPPRNADGAGAREDRVVRSAAEAKARAVERLDAGVDYIKVHEWLPAEWIREIAVAAHARNKAVVGHLSTPVGEAVDAGLDGLIHPYAVDLSTLDDAAKLDTIRRNMPRYAARIDYYPFHLLEPARYAPLITRMVQRGAFFNPTFGAQFRGIYPEREEFERYDSRFLELQTLELGYLVPSIRQKLLPFFNRVRFQDVGTDRRQELERGMENVAELMRQYQRAGGRMVAGTDTSSIGLPGIRLHRELQLWVSRGIPAMEALRAATQYPAQLYRLPDVGTLAPGKWADIVVLNGNPLDDMRLLGAIDAVVQGGRLVHRTLNPSSFLPLIRGGA